MGAVLRIFLGGEMCMQDGEVEDQKDETVLSAVVGEREGRKAADR